MDRLIKRFDCEVDGDLALCHKREVAYQLDMSRALVQYDEHYFNKCLGYEGQEIANAINEGRINLVNKWARRFPYCGREPVLDIGIGSGEFIKRRPETFGYDINPAATKWLMEAGKYRSDIANFLLFTFWDVIEHVPDINVYFKRIPRGAMVFCSLPLFEDLTRIRDSKHYRPGEHLYYWTREGFINWMSLYGFQLVDEATFEIDAGREDIYTFAFRRTLPRYHETLEQYMKLYLGRYGASARIYLDAVLPAVLELDPGSVLDYGCGTSDLVAYFYKDGQRRLERYDPAIPEYKALPDGQFDLVLCFDVMEHIRMEDVDRVLKEISSKSTNVLFTISLVRARRSLPDGRNAHVTLLSRCEWLSWLEEYFEIAVEIPCKWDHILMVKTY